MSTPPEERDANGLPARYANHFEVRYNAAEFLLDFCQLGPESSRPWRHTRIVTPPTYAKALVVTLLDSIRLYEATYGPIAGDP